MRQNNTRMTLAVLSIAIAATLPLALSTVYSQGDSNQSGGNQSAGGNASSQGIGSAQELTQALGNNTELLTNNTPIGNPNASTAEKMSAESNVTDNQSMLGGNQSSSNQTSGNQSSSNQTSGNQSNPLKGLVEGIGKLFGNATGK